MNYLRNTGDFGEKLAKKYLISQGYEIIGCNLKLGFGELDIVAKKQGIYVFVEVKTRTSRTCGDIEDSMFGRKTKILSKTVESYLNKFKITGDNFRVDLITVEFNHDDKMAKLKHYQDIT